MVQALAPRFRRGSSWVWLWFWVVPIGLVTPPSLAQTPDAKTKSAPPKAQVPTTKGAPPQTKAAGKAAAPAPSGEAKPESADDVKRDSGEIFKDPNAEKSLANTFTQIPYPTPRPTPQDITAVRNMAGGLIPPDRALIDRYVTFMAAELTNRANIRGLIDPPQNQAPNGQTARAIERASSGLIDPLTIARSQQNPNLAFLALYVPMLQTKLTPLLENHLIARIQAAIVLGMAASPTSVDLFLKQLSDPNQVVWVKLWAARGLTNVTQNGQVTLDEAKGLAVASTLMKLLDDSEIPWPAQIRFLEALGSNRRASTSLVDRKADVLETVAMVLTEADFRHDVRAWAAYAIGVIGVNGQIAKVNYPLVTTHVGLLAAEIGDRIVSEYDTLTTQFEKNKGPATYLTGLLIYQIEPAFTGLPSVRNSGLINQAHPSAVANKPFAQSVEGLVRNVGKAAVELTRAGGTAQKAARDTLQARIGELRAFLELPKNKPTDLDLTPGGTKFPLTPAAGGSK